jgi:hypothetical protein
VGVDSITHTYTAHTDFPIDNLIDDRAGTLFKFAGTNLHTIDVDLGPDFDIGIDRLIIPANHNITWLRVREDSDSGYGSMQNLKDGVENVVGELIDLEFESASTERYIRVDFYASAQHYLSQLVLTKIVTLDVGPALADSTDGKIDNVTRLERNNGQSPTIQHGPQQRVIEYEYESPLEGGDLTAMEALVNSVGMHRPFWVDPAEFHATPGTDEPVLWMKFAEMPESRNSILVPMNGARSKVYRLSLIESLD